MTQTTQTTRTRNSHIPAVALIILGIIAGGVCWVLDGTIFWVMTGVSLVFIVAGLTVASRAARIEQMERREGE